MPGPRGSKQRLDVTIDGRELSLSNLGKVLYPDAGFTKGQVIDYYTRIAPAVLPHLKGRCLTLKRYPDGVDGGHFYEKNAPAHRPPWVRTAPVFSRHAERVIEFVLCDDLPTLVWCAQLADLELHPSLALAEDVERPNILAFDLDPGPPATIVECARVGLLVRDLFERLGLECFAKTSGSKGMQVYVPLCGSRHTYEDTKPFARTVALLLERDHPELVVSDMKKALREGRVLVDWSQNDEHKTTVGVYSLRAKAQPTVSTPVTWDEVEDGLRSGDPDELSFTSDEVLARVDRHGDLFAPVTQLEQELPRLGGR